MGINIIDDDEKPVENKRQNNNYQKDQFSQFKESGVNIAIVLIMGVVLISGIWLSQTDCPDVTVPACPNITVPSCPSVTIPSCPDCNPVIDCRYNQTNMTEYSYLNTTITNITVFNSTNMNQNLTYGLTENMTAEFNVSSLGDLIKIKVNYE